MRGRIPDECKFGKVRLFFRYARGQFHGAQLLLYRHTHITHNIYKYGLSLFNPGAAAGTQATYGVIDIGGQIAARLVNIKFCLQI